MKLFIAPSILSADFGKLNAEMASVEKYVDLFHIDVMDGYFVPNITFGPPAVASMKMKLPLDCHLMIQNPGKYIESFVNALKAHKRPLNQCYIVIHREVFSSVAAAAKVLRKIKSYGVKAGIALNPNTSLKTIKALLPSKRAKKPLLDLVLIMSVYPGFGGQKFIASVLTKIKTLRKRFPKLDIEIDGGMNDKTVKLAREAGANIIVAGSYIFHAKNRKQAIDKLKI